MSQNTLGCNITYLCEKAGKSISQVAIDCGLAASSLLNIVSGQVTSPRIKTLASIAAYFNRDVHLLLTENLREYDKANYKKPKDEIEECVEEMKNAGLSATESGLLVDGKFRVKETQKELAGDDRIPFYSDETISRMCLSPDNFGDKNSFAADSFIPGTPEDSLNELKLFAMVCPTDTLYPMANAGDIIYVKPVGDSDFIKRGAPIVAVMGQEDRPIIGTYLQEAGHHLIRSDAFDEYREVYRVIGIIVAVFALTGGTYNGYLDRWQRKVR